MLCPRQSTKTLVNWVMPISLINWVLLISDIYLIWNLNILIKFKFVPVLLVVTVNLAAELIAYFLNRYNYKNGSAWIYNFSLPIELISYALLYRRIFKQPTYTLLINGFLIAIPVFSIITFFTNRTIYIFQTPVFVFGCIFILFLTLSFFIKLFIADYFQINPLKQFFFWLSTGLLMCYLGSFIYLSNLNSLFKHFTFLYAELQNLNFLLNCFLYICIIISIECLKAHPNSQIQSF